ncbi:flavodoxin FldA [Prevotella sp. 10(H)]|uniref:flavodoxin FldA n=1 Tax=Prevotella sp. 10(H) TaxID=1158294 RepID=UPI0004A73F14|nr:flavodoxin FldA [Prevotella sp. 10(H)]
MSKIGIYYGSTTGNTQEVAEEIAKKLNVDKTDLHDVSKANADYSAYDVVLFGSPTLGYGDLQDDWEDYIDKVKEADLNGKKVALFGCGDSSSYSDTFGDAIGKIYEVIKDKGCQLVGQVSTEGYTYDSSEAVVEGQFVGLLIDNDNESNMTDQRIALWTEDLKKVI